jgi:hypothetical protein
VTADQGWSERGAVATATLADTWTSLAGVGLDLGASGVGPAHRLPRLERPGPVLPPDRHRADVARGEGSHLERAVGRTREYDLAASHEPWVAVRRSLDGGGVRAEDVVPTPTVTLSALDFMRLSCGG